MPQYKYEGNQTAEPVMYRCEWDDPESVLPGSRFGPVVRNVFIVECNVSGYGSLIIGNTEYPIAPGDTYVMLPGLCITQTADKDDPRRALWCSFGGMNVGKILSDVGITETSPFLPREKFADILKILEKIYSMNGENGLSCDFLRTSCLYELFAAFAKGKAVANRNLFIERAIGIMESGYHTGITVADIAAEVGFDRCYFSSLFKHHTGVTPHVYLTKLRIARATSLLESGNYQISEVAESVGLDPRNFARLFKRETGKTPNSFKSLRKVEN